MRFSSRDALEDILKAPVPVGTPFYLLWRRWRRQSMASAGTLRFKVLVGLMGIPAHAWDVESAERILGSSCAHLVEAPGTLARDDLREFVVAAWCVHPNCIPQEEAMAIPEPELPFFIEPPLYSEFKLLRYRVRISIIEVQDWRTPDRLGDNHDPNWPNAGQHGCSTPWPRRHRFGNGGAAGDAAPDPTLGPRWGSTFQEAPAVVVGDVHCPISSCFPRRFGPPGARAPLSPSLSLSGMTSPIHSTAPRGLEKRSFQEFEFQVASSPHLTPQRPDPMLLLLEEPGPCLDEV